MGIFLNAIDHAITQYEIINKSKPDVLILDKEKMSLFSFEIMEFSNEKKYKLYCRKNGFRYYNGLIIIELKITFQGGCSWALGKI